MRAFPIGQLEDDYDQANRHFKAAPIGLPDQDQTAVATMEPPKAGPVPIAGPTAATPGPAPIVAPAKAPIGDAKLEADKTELSRLQNSGSRLDQLGQKPGLGHKIASVLGRIGDIAGSAFMPFQMEMIPGTTLHHNSLVRQAAGRVTGDLEEQQQEAETVEKQAKATQENAKAQSLLNPTQKPVKAEPLFDKNGAVIGFRTDEGELLGPNSKNLTDDMRDILQSSSPKQQPKKPAHINYDSGIPVSVTTGDGNVFDVNDPKLPAELKPLVDAANRAHGQKLKEESDKQARAFAQQQKLFDARQDALTANTKNMVQAAPAVLKLSGRIRQLVTQQKDSLGPSASRWNEFMAGKVGSPNPEFTKLRTDVGLLSTKLMQMHVGSRGGEMIMEHFKNLIDSGRQSPENLIAALDEIDQYAHDVQSEGNHMGGGDAVEEYVRDPKTGKLVKK